MTIEIVTGDLLAAFKTKEVDYIAHCVNAQGVFGSGVALQVKQQYPSVYGRYLIACDNEDDQILLLGKAQKVLVGWESEERAIFNLFGQLNYGTSKRQGNYGAIATCLLNMRKQITKSDIVVGFPYKMCSDRAGCDWNIILEMIEYFFSDVTVKVYKLG